MPVTIKTNSYSPAGRYGELSASGWIEWHFGTIAQTWVPAAPGELVHDRLVPALAAYQRSYRRSGSAGTGTGYVWTSWLVGGILSLV